MFSPPHPNVSLLFLVTRCSYHVFVGPLSASECWSAILVGWNDWDDPHVWVGAAGGRINRVSTNISTGKLCSKVSPLIYCYLYIDEKQYDIYKTISCLFEKNCSDEIINELCLYVIDMVVDWKHLISIRLLFTHFHHKPPRWCFQCVM